MCPKLQPICACNIVMAGLRQCSSMENLVHAVYDMLAMRLVHSFIHMFRPASQVTHTAIAPTTASCPCTAAPCCQAQLCTSGFGAAGVIIHLRCGRPSTNDDVYGCVYSLCDLISRLNLQTQKRCCILQSGSSFIHSYVHTHIHA
jgi:hypothetical protein